MKLPFILLALASFSCSVYGRPNLDSFQWPSRSAEIPQLKDGDSANISWVSSVAANILTLWCGDGNQSQVFQLRDFPSQGSHIFNVTSEWKFPCHFQMAVQEGFSWEPYGWFDSSDMDGTSEQRDPQLFTAQTSTGTCDIPEVNSPTNSSESITSSCPAAQTTIYQNTESNTQLARGVGIGVGISTGIACIVGSIILVWRRRRLSAESSSNSREKLDYARYAHAGPTESANVYRPPEGPRYLNGHPVELTGVPGPFELHAK